VDERTELLLVIMEDLKLQVSGLRTDINKLNEFKWKMMGAYTVITSIITVVGFLMKQ